MSKRIVIIGGGLTGCSVAAQLCDAAKEPLDIQIIEPRPLLGRGVAYSADDPDHRLNAPLIVHFLTPGKGDAFQKWFVEGDALDQDPDALAPDGNIYARRQVFGSYITGEMAALSKDNKSNSTITHVQAQVTDIQFQGNEYRLSLKNQPTLSAERLVMATGNQAPNAPHPFKGQIEEHPAYFNSPWNLKRIRNIDSKAKILIIGAGLTMSDLVATLVKQNHQGKITAISRNGFRPQTHAKPKEDGPPRQPFENIMADKPDYYNGTLLEIFKDLRLKMAADMAAGGQWHWGFDGIRDCVWQIWPNFSDADKRSYLRHLRPWYDSHRFRLPPQTAQILDDSIERGLLNYQIGNIISAKDSAGQLAVKMKLNSDDHPTELSFDAVINSTGPSLSPVAAANPIYRALLDNGLARPTKINIGFDVDLHCRAIQKDGTISNNFHIVGPPTLGAFGDPIGIPFIVSQISRVIPSMLDD
jgi:uncharacterized NAD(P)/FAD-binding protein YdhS